MKVVVTGGAGFIGSHIVDGLAAVGHDVTSLDDLSGGRRANVRAGVDLMELDVASAKAAARIVALAPTVLVHCAAQASVVASIADPVQDAQTNIIGTLQMLRGATEAGVSTFIYITTGGALYGETTMLPTREDAPVQPLSPYGLSKWVGEQYLQRIAPEHMAVAALRLANVYGPRQRSDGEGGVVSIFLDRMRHREPVAIYGDGDQTRDFVYVGDVVEAVMLAIDHNRSMAVNVGSGTGTSVNRLFELAAEITGYQHAPVHLAPRHGEVRHSRLDVTAASELLGWIPRTGLRAGLEATASALQGRR